jgi:membrane protease YdiL (CAAX protease family)
MEPPESSEPPGQPPPLLAGRLTALLEVLLCSGLPTQLSLGTTLAMLGYGPFLASGQLNPGYVVALSLLDTLVLGFLIFLFLRARGERPGDVFLGSRPPGREALVGLPLAGAALLLALAVLISLREIAPWLRTVEQNPLQDLLGNPRDVAVFALVAVVAGGVREEIQRAFLLHRFERWLGGAAAGLTITSVAFGAGHLLQGADAAVATGMLGALWGLTFLRRRSVVAPVVSHAAFNLLQLLQFFVIGQ